GVLCVAVGTFLVSLPIAWASYELLETRLAKRLRGLLASPPSPAVAVIVASPVAATAIVQTPSAAPIELPPA
ncbi:MAG: hypothetical protein ABW321_17325, partial [Polyangiales bacterium]